MYLVKLTELYSTKSELLYKLSYINYVSILAHQMKKNTPIQDVNAGRNHVEGELVYGNFVYIFL